MDYIKSEEYKKKKEKERIQAKPKFDNSKYQIIKIDFYILDKDKQSFNNYSYQKIIKKLIFI